MLELVWLYMGVLCVCSRDVLNGPGRGLSYT